jgi:hypothetical protein
LRDVRVKSRDAPARGIERERHHHAAVIVVRTEHVSEEMHEEGCGVPVDGRRIECLDRLSAGSPTESPRRNDDHTRDRGRESLDGSLLTRGQWHVGHDDDEVVRTLHHVKCGLIEELRRSPGGSVGKRIRFGTVNSPGRVRGRR